MGTKSDSKREICNEAPENWKWTTDVKMRMKTLLETGFESDLNLIVGDAREEIKVHKLLLMSASPWFHQNLRNIPCHSGEPGVLEIKNMDPRYFKVFLKHLYTGESGANITDALGLLNIAIFYQTEDLIAECNQLLDGTITNKVALQLFQDAMHFCNKKLIHSSLDHICKNAGKILVRGEFRNLRLECLMEILKQDGLCVQNEMEVFDAVIKWGEAESLRKGLDPLEPKNMRNILNKAIAYVRFPNMEQAEFALKVATKSLLDETELISLMICFMVPQENRSQLPSGRFISMPRKYTTLLPVQPTQNIQIDPKPVVTGKRYWIARGDIPIQYTSVNNQTSEEALIFKVDKSLWLSGVKIFILNSSKFFPDFKYEYSDLTINYAVSIAGSKTKKILKNENEKFVRQILFNDPIRLQKNQRYKLEMSFRGSISWCKKPENKKTEGKYKTLSKDDCYYVVDGNYKHIQTFKPTTQSGSTEEINIEFSRDTDEKLPISCGFMEEFIFQLE